MNKQAFLYILLCCFLGGFSLQGQPRFWEPTFGPYSGMVDDLAFTTDFAFATSGPLFSRKEVFRKPLGGGPWQNITDEAMYLNNQNAKLVVSTDGILFLSGDGLWRSTNNGLNWVKVTESFGFLTVSDYMITPDNVLYMIIYDGVFRSYDFGGTWEPLPQSDLIDQGTVFLSSVFSNSQGHIFIGTDEQISRSTNGGATWETIIDGLVFIDEPFYPEINIPEKIAEAPDGTLYLMFFSEVDEDDFNFNPEYSLYRSANNGDSWEALPTAPSSSFYYDLLVNEANEVLLATEDGLYVSSDNGGSWSAINYADVTAGVRSIASGADGLFYIGQTDYGIYQRMSTNAPYVLDNTGILSENRINTLNNTASGRLYAGTTGPYYGSNNSPYLNFTTDSGENWNQRVYNVNNPDFFDGVICYKFVEAPDGTPYAATDFGIFKGLFDGEFWTPVISDFHGPYYDLAINGSGELFGVKTDRLEFSNDEGTTWSIIFSDYVADIEINEAGHIYLATPWEGVYLSIDNGNTWIHPSNNNLNGAFISEMILDRRGRLWIGTGSGGVFRSDNNGEDWEMVGGALEGGEVVSMVESAMGILYAATADEVYELNYDFFFFDTYWYPIGEGLPKPLSDEGPTGEITALEVDDANYLFVGTEFGAYRSRVPVSSHRDTWTVLNEPFNNGLPNNWTAEVIKGDVTWAWTDVGPSGPTASSSAPLQSEEPDNGWMIFDSDLVNNNPEGQEGWLISPQLFYDGFSERTFLSFQTFYLSYYDRPTLRIGTDLDDKENWEVIEVFPGIQASQFGGTIVGNPRLNPQSIEIDITSYLPQTPSYYYVAFVFQSDETTINGPSGNAYGWAFNWQIDDVVIQSYRPASDLTIAAASPPYFSVPASQLAPFNLGAEAFNVGYNLHPGATTSVVIEKEGATGSEVVWEASREEGELGFTGFIIYIPFYSPVVFEEPFSPMASAGQSYEITYRVTPGLYPDLVEENSEVSYQLQVTDTLFQKETTTRLGISFEDDDAPSDSYSIANIFYVPNDENSFGQPLYARYMSFGVTNAADLAGKTVQTALYKWDGDTDEDLVIDPEEYSGLPVATNSYTFTGEEGNDLITIPVSSGGFIPLDAGHHYVALVRYESEGGQKMLFQVSDEADLRYSLGMTLGMPQPWYHSAVDYGNTGEIVLLNQDYFADPIFFHPIPVIRLSVGTEILSKESNAALPTQALQLFPNPARETFKLNIDLEQPAAWAQVRLMNSNGQTIISRNLGSIQKELISFDVAALPAGLYSVEILTDLGRKNLSVAVE